MTNIVINCGGIRLKSAGKMDPRELQVTHKPSTMVKNDAFFIIECLDIALSFTFVNTIDFYATFLRQLVALVTE